MSGSYYVLIVKAKNENEAEEKAQDVIDNVLAGEKGYFENGRTALAEAKEDDFVYLDPPYYPTSETANFVSYTSNGFTKGDHVTLSKLFAELSDRKCIVFRDPIRSLHSDFYIKEVNASRAINSDPSRRAGDKNTELLISNYPK
jgi:DNA adenine methylase